MTSIIRSGALLLCCALTLPAQAADSEARQWLERMSRALAERNYDGRFFHLSESRSETLRIIHRVDRGKITERLVSLDGSGREIVRNETEVICYLPDKRTVLVEKRTDSNPLLVALPAYNEGLESHYSIERVGGVVKALGRRTQMILVQPRDQYRYGYRLWLDEETAMPLKSQLCDRNGKVIEQMLFAELNFRDKISADELKPAITGEGFKWLRQDAEQPRIANAVVGWDVVHLPAGFKLTTWRIQIIAGSSAPVRHLVYSDGLASVSVFIEPRSSAEAAQMHGLARLGAAFAFSRDLDGHQVTAVGEVPAATVEAIAAGVTRQDRAAREEGADRRDQAAAPPPR
ncbi:MAG TPA: MucB/RseB C-terminal domain-containing protein [Steroidobacteraceae bacterium]